MDAGVAAVRTTNDQDISVRNRKERGNEENKTEKETKEEDTHSLKRGD